MKLVLVSEHLPEREGSATGRILRATVDGLLSDGHEVSVVAWTDRAPREDLPSWARHQPISRTAGLRDHLEALWRPRWASSRVVLETDPDAVHVAEEPLSFAAVSGQPRNAVVVHFSGLLDARALGRPGPSDVQSHRSDRRAVRGADAVLPYSARVAAAVGAHVAAVPAAICIPEAPLALVDRPAALLMAGWDWAPNHAALRALLDGWPDVRQRCAGAELVLAGRGAPAVAGARVLGEVPRSWDAFAEAAVLAFPCPPTSGPKTKVLEAMAAGLPVVTTPSGVEGLVPSAAAAAVVVELPEFALALAELLADPARRAVLAQAGRAAVAEGHAPLVAARARIAALTRG